VLALQRISQGQNGRLVYRMKRLGGGSLFLVLTPDELIARIATLVPPPRVHGVRYHGVFAPNSKARKRVVPAAPSVSEPQKPPPPVQRASGGSSKKLRHERPADEPLRTYRVPWAELLRKVFALDVLACPQCGGRMQIIAFIAQPKVARRILDHLGLDSTGPPLARAQSQPEEFDPGPDYSAFHYRTRNVSYSAYPPKINPVGYGWKVGSDVRLWPGILAGLRLF